MQNHIKFIFLSHIIFISIGFATASRCGYTGNFTSNSTYANNRYQILSSLAPNVSANGGFFNNSIGQEPYKVYALGLCRGDAAPEYCFDCISSTSQQLMAECPNQKEATLWALKGQCLVRYANRSFFGILELDPMDYGDIINSSNITEFDQKWDDLMARVIDRASSGSSRIKYATEEVRLTQFQDIHALMQCTPDLSQSDCRSCLRENVVSFKSYCHGKHGCSVQRPNCYLRSDLSPFYNASASPPAPPPPSLSPPPSPSSNSPPGTTNTTNANNDDDGGGIEPGTIAAIVVPTVTFIAFLALTCIFLIQRRKKRYQEVENEVESVKSLQFDLATIRNATDNFSDANKLGQGGFGAVYKGTLPDGQYVAVKRLSRHSSQGEVEFKNEVLLMTKLQHRNLVKLLGFCLAGNERLLIYEFVPNSSLDHFLFDPTKRALLNWQIRYRIFGGIARGLLYLHEDSRLRIIHRDLKAGNIMLDEEMSPKISDFGMAKLFEVDQTQDATSRVVGTYGYMAPEYVRHGRFSVKSDVYSFGVLVLEIISGQKINRFRYREEAEDLLTFAWKNWNGGTVSNLIDPTLRVGSRSEMVRCIHIGLLCVQENEASRPTMASVVLMFSSSSVSLSAPLRPAFFSGTFVDSEASASTTTADQSVKFTTNEASITDLVPR
ncbi:putative receptor-like protein kinase At4g00960 isoform X2 [Tripterygium wilfordii]|uniref:putative receptor-like protein kinase At4g00960 isoform X2 n=1 Tax=Tripterygium wilfordii TaxID=458696 RepID=UPI0018F7F530|nr:putative receptor-like protein kinase At4g00960 isoform X2 [Tripterygium wilfordii]